jgi:3,4-dihydroxy 2-butanone 4-phosphate synthase / GTP cyclohydrolase II
MQFVSVIRYSQARLPTIHGEFTLLVYRTGQSVALGGTAIGPGPEEHMVLVMGDVANKTDVVARVHSSCFTGEVLGSLRCDCRAQLDAAMAEIAKAGSGLIVYLVQEGRGIGLGNKIKAYALQDQGADTVEANLQLGFDADARSYSLAAAMFRDVGVASVRLLTNNPDKIRGLRDAGTVVSAQQSLWVEHNPHSASYLDVKKEKLGHIK